MKECLWLGVSAVMIMALSAREWEDERVNSVNREPARAVSFPLDSVKAAFTDDEPATPYRLRLNGDWKFMWNGSPADRPENFFEPGFDDSRWYTIDVPSCVEMRGYGIPIYTNIRYPHARTPPLIGMEYNPVSSYRRSFEIPSGWKDRPVFVRFDGVYSAFYLWVNGQYVGYSEDSKLPAEFNLTKYLKAGPNQIAVQVYRWSDGAYLEDQDMFRFSGIYREVSLFSPPPVELRDFWATTRLDSGYKRATLGLRLKARALNAQAAEAVVKSTLYDAKGRMVVTPVVKLAVKADGADAEAKVEVAVENPQLWSAEDPYLYTLVLELTSPSGVDIRSCKVGFRQVEIKGGTILFNGKAIKFKGVNRHETDPAEGRSISREMMLKDILLLKQNNINTVRTAHYPTHYYWYQLCDRYGIYLVGEANVESHGMGYGPESLSHVESWKAAHVERNVNQVENYKNHPSIFMWSMGNEAGPGLNFKAAIDAVHALDNTRPVHYERANNFADVDSTMYPTVEWLYSRGENKEKPFFLCEYAHAMGNAMGNFKEYWEAFYSSESLTGGCIWDWVDQAIWKYTDRIGPDGKRERYLAYGGDFDDMPNDGNFVCNGVIAPDRQVTPKLVEVKRVHQNIMAAAENAAEGKVEIWNRFGFTATSEFDAFWELTCDGKVIDDGVLALPEVAPLSRRTVEIPVPLVKPLEGAEYLYRIRFCLKKDTLWAGKGHEVAVSQLPFKTTAAVVKAEAAEIGGVPELSVAEGDASVTVKGARFEIVFSRSSGTIARLTYAGKAVISDQGGIAHGPRVNVFRAFVDNDGWMRKGFADSGLSQMAYHARPITVERISAQAVRVLTEVDACGFKSARFKHQSEYLITGDGVIAVQHSLVPSGAMPSLPRLGVSMMLDGALERIAYYGRGPWENYVDRNTGSDIGYYESTVTDQYVDYIKPQECGGRSEVRWVALTDSAGDGVLIKAYQPLFMSALHYTAEDLEFARHRNGQQRIYNMPDARAEVCLTLDIGQMGLGGGSCGPGPMSKYLMAVQPVSFGYLMRPCQAGQMNLSREARKPATLPHAATLERDEEGSVAITGCGEIRYTLDGSEPTQASALYSAPFRAVDAVTVKAAVFSPSGGRSSVCEVAFKKLTGMVKRSGARLRVVDCDSEQKPGEGPAVHAVDGNSSTFWHSRWEPKEAPYPHFITVDAGELTQIGGITLQGRTDGNTNGNVHKYRIFVSKDGQAWGGAVAEGELGKTQTTEQRVEFGRMVEGRYVKFEALSEVQNRPFAAIAEIGVLVAL